MGFFIQQIFFNEGFVEATAEGVLKLHPVVAESMATHAFGHVFSYLKW